MAGTWRNGLFSRTLITQHTQMSHRAVLTQLPQIFAVLVSRLPASMKPSQCHYFSNARRQIRVVFAVHLGAPRAVSTVASLSASTTSRNRYVWNHKHGFRTACCADGHDQDRDFSTCNAPCWIYGAVGCFSFQWVPLLMKYVPSFSSCLHLVEPV